MNKQKNASLARSSMGLVSAEYLSVQFEKFRPELYISDRRNWHENVTYHVDANSAACRVGVITIAGKAFKVKQKGS